MVGPQEVRNESRCRTRPPAISLRREVDDARERIAAATTEAQVRDLVAAINERIRHVNSHTISGPPTSIGVLDVDDVVRTWRANRSSPGDTPTSLSHPLGMMSA